MKARFRRALPGDAEALTAIAVAAKAHWGYDAAFIERVAEVIAVGQAYIVANDVWVLELGGRRVGFYGLIHHGNVAELDHLWLMPEYIGRGLGRAAFEHAVDRAVAQGAIRLEWEAEPNATGFYRRMGGQPVREVTSRLGRRLEVFALDLLTAWRPPPGSRA